MRLSVVFELGPKSQKMLLELANMRDQIESEEHNSSLLDELIVKVYIMPNRYARLSDIEERYSDCLEVSNLEGYIKIISRVGETTITVLEEVAIRAWRDKALMPYLKKKIAERVRAFVD